MPPKRKPAPQPLQWSLYKIEEERKRVAMSTKKRIDELCGPTETLRAHFTFDSGTFKVAAAFLVIVLCLTFISGLATQALQGRRNVYVNVLVICKCLCEMLSKF